MARVPYRDLSQVDPQLINRIVQERGSVLHLYQILLTSPALAQGWLSFFTSIRQQLQISPRLRELIIVYIAILNDAEYEASQHIPIAIKAGATEAEIQALRDMRQYPSAFSAPEQSVLTYTREMTLNIKVSDACFDKLRSFYNDQDVVEFTGLVGAYNLASRFLEALQIRSHDTR